MSFSYNSSLEAWKPTKEDDARIRILELYPPIWFLRWLPQSWLFRLPLHARLAWAPLGTVRIPNKIVHAENSLKTSPILTEQSTTPNQDSTTSTEDRTTFNKSESKPAQSSSTYKALSYTWGDCKAKSVISVNGKKLTITDSLTTALYHIRPKSESLKIWIDQICINQEDLQEKTDQVRRMDRVYRNSDEALIWLGPAEHGSEEFMTVLNKLGAFAESFNLISYYTRARYHELHAIETKKDPEDPKTIEYHAFCDPLLHLFDYAFFEGLIAFYQRPWFRRTWVVQEFSLPPEATFICGMRRIKAETFMCVVQMIILTFSGKIIETDPNNRKLIALMETWTDSISNTASPLFGCRQRRKLADDGKQDRDSLYAMLQKFCVDGNQQATQGCDLVYGVLGLVGDAEELGIRAEYTEEDQDRQAAITFSHTARAIIKSGKVDLLMSAQHVKRDMTLPSWVPDWRTALSQSFAENNAQQRIDFVALAMSRKMEQDGTLPSWVPDWRSVLSRSFAWLADHRMKPLFHASDDQPLNFHDEEDKQILVLDGYVVDEIEELGGPWTVNRIVDGTGSRFPHEDYLNYLAQVRQLCLLSKAKGNGIHPSLERYDEAIWRVPVGDLDQDPSYFVPMRAGPACKLKYEHCLAELEMMVEVHAWTMEEYNARAAELVEMGKRRVDDSDDGKNNGTMYRLRIQEMRGKRPFLSRLGYVGMGPQYMRTGDVVVILNGASVPFIVRPVGEGRFRLMGECYCDGIMYGEFVKHGGKVQKIVLV